MDLFTDDIESGKPISAATFTKCSLNNSATLFESVIICSFSFNVMKLLPLDLLSVKKGEIVFQNSLFGFSHRF